MDNNYIVIEDFYIYVRDDLMSFELKKGTKCKIKIHNTKNSFNRIDFLEQILCDCHYQNKEKKTYLKTIKNTPCPYVILIKYEKYFRKELEYKFDLLIENA